MAGVVQWGIDRFWGELQSLEDIAKSIKADLAANKLELQHAWSLTKLEAPATRAQHQALLSPLIHRNSVLRTQYLAPIVAKFNQAVNAASSALKGAGYSTPRLGFVFAIAPAAAVAIVVAALALAYTAQRLTEVQVSNSHNVTAMIKAGFAPDDIRKVEKDQPKGDNPFDLGKLAPVLGLVLAVIVAPTLMKLIPKRGAA